MLIDQIGELIKNKKEQLYLLQNEINLLNKANDEVYSKNQLIFRILVELLKDKITTDNSQYIRDLIYQNKITYNYSLFAKGFDLIYKYISRANDQTCGLEVTQIINEDSILPFMEYVDDYIVNKNTKNNTLAA